MNQRDVNCLFTKKVSEFIRQGFLIHTESMVGSQGDIVKVDLYKGDEIIRVWKEEELDFSGESYNGYLFIRIGKLMEGLQGKRCERIAYWDLQLLSEIKLGRITHKYFVPPEKSDAFLQKKLSRQQNRDLPLRRELTSDALKSVALKYVRRQPQMAMCQLKDIEKVVRMNRVCLGVTTAALDGYEITARGKTYQILSRLPKRT